MRKISVVAALFISSHSFAQDSTKTLEELTLTASKYSTKTTQTGKVVTIISRQDIEKAGSRDLAQVISELGGTFINGSLGNAGKEKNIYLRGAKVEHTLITIDGVPVYDATGIGSNFDIRNISIDNVERIEILKGSQGTLYGSDAIAGVINIITKKNSAQQSPTVNHVMHYGSYQTFRTATDVNGQHKWLGYQLGFSHLASDGFSEAKNLNTITAFEKDSYRQNSMSAQFNIRAVKGWELQPFFRYTHFKGDLDLDAGTDEKDYSNSNRNLQAGARNSIGIGKGTLNLLYQYTNTIRHYLDDSLYLDNFAYYLYNKQKYTGHEHFAEAFYIYPTRYVKITAGIDARSANTSYESYQKNVFSPLPEVHQYSGDSVEQKQLGVYAAGNFHYKIFSIEAGGRLNHHSVYGSNSAFNINPSVFIKERFKLFANISTGYKTPGLYQLFSIYGNQELKPENSLNVETGLQLYTKDHLKYFRAVYFNREVKDVIAFIPTATTPYAQYVNQDIQKDKGIELEAAVSFKKIQLKAMYYYVDGDVTTKQSGKDTTFFNLLRRPKNLLNIFAGVQATYKFYFSVQLNRVGSRKDIYFDPYTFQAVDLSLPSYMLLNFYADYSLLHSKVKLFADVRNVLDEDYMDIYGYSTAGLNAYAGIRFKF